MSNAIFYVDTQIYKSEWSLSKKYVFCFYYSLMFLGIGEIGPVGIFGTFSALGLLCFSFIINNFLLGEFASLMNQVQMSSSVFQEKFDQANEILEYIGLNDKDSQALRGFFMKTQQTKDIQEELDMFFSEITRSLIGKVQDTMFQEVLVTNIVIRKFFKLDKLLPANIKKRNFSKVY